MSFVVCCYNSIYGITWPSTFSFLSSSQLSFLFFAFILHVFWIWTMLWINRIPNARSRIALRRRTWETQKILTCEQLNSGRFLRTNTVRTWKWLHNDILASCWQALSLSLSLSLSLFVKNCFLLYKTCVPCLLRSPREFSRAYLFSSMPFLLFLALSH